MRSQGWTRHLLVLGRPAEAYICGGYFELPEVRGSVAVGGGGDGAGERGALPCRGGGGE